MAWGVDNIEENAPQTPLICTKTPEHAEHIPGTTQASQLGPAVEGMQTH